MPFAVANDGWTPITIVGAGRSSSAMQLIAVEDVHFPITLGPGQATDITLVYQVTDCFGIPAEEWPIPVRLERIWGTQTVYVDPSPQVPNMDNPNVSAEDLLDRSSLTFWHAARASYVCKW